MLRIREMRSEEADLLKDFLYEAIFVPEGEDPLPGEIIYKPELRIYYEDWGSGRADVCMVAQEADHVVGAAWTRIMDDYGHVDDETPSFAISLYKEYRGQGIGTQPMNTLFARLKEMGFERVSLSVQKANYAVRMYEKAGFRPVEDKDGEYIMVKEL